MKENTFTGARNPFMAPRRNLVAIAIQYFTLSPNRVLKTMLNIETEVLKWVSNRTSNGAYIVPFVLLLGP
jgi:hypothetical protein